MILRTTEAFIRIMLWNVAHHDDLYGDRNGQLGFESVIYLLYNEHHPHDHQGDNHITDIRGGNLVEDDLQGLKRWKSEIQEMNDPYSQTLINSLKQL